MTDIDKYVLLYRQTINDLSGKVSDKADLEERLTEVRSEIYKLRQIATSLSAYRGLDPRTEYPDLFVDNLELDAGITSRVRGCFTSDKALSATQVRNSLLASKYDLTDYKNALATIHTILKRLVKAGELFVVNEDGEQGSQTMYMMPPAETIPVAKRVAEILKKKRPAWAEYLAERGGLILGNPPHFASGKRMTTRMRREVAETLRESEQPDMPRRLLPKEES